MNVYTCYKVARRGIYNSLDLEADSFPGTGDCGQGHKKKIKDYGGPDRLSSHTYAQSKKIRYYDAFKIIIRMNRSRFRRKR